MSIPLPVQPPSTPPASPLYQAPQLRYFISRNNGTLVPLVPADELPYNIRLEGVQRVMTMENASGMTLVGTLPFTGRLFKLHTSSIQRPEVIISSKPAALPSATAVTWRRKDESLKDATQAKIDTIVASEVQPTTRPKVESFKASKPPSPSSRSTPDPGEKVYCTHWIRHGECDYIQQGCRYKHEMPDRATLTSIGFRTVPRWWQEKIAVQLGQSAIPTVGPVVKPEEWLKRRRSSLGSESESSDSDSEMEDIETNTASAEKEMPVQSQLKKEKDEVSPSCEKSGRAPGNVETLEPKPTSQPAMAISTAEPTVTKSRQLSLTGDLIDLKSPVLSPPCFPKATLSATALNTTIPCTPTVRLNDHFSQKAEFKQTPTAPRKVFVPAGESREHHIAEFRKHAETQACKQRKSYVKELPPKDATTTPPTTQTIILPALSGLMASKHAPIPMAPTFAITRAQSTASDPNQSTINNAPVGSKVPTTTKAQRPAKLSSKKTSSPKVAIQTNHKPTSSPRPGVANSKPGVGSAAGLQMKTAKLPRSVPDACRPRRPKVQVSKSHE